MKEWKNLHLKKKSVNRESKRKNKVIKRKMTWDNRINSMKENK